MRKDPVSTKWKEREGEVATKKETKIGVEMKKKKVRRKKRKKKVKKGRHN